MAELQRVTNILGAGSYPAGLFPKLYAPCRHLSATSTILTMGRVDFNRATASEPTSFGGDGILDVSPSPKEILNAIGFIGKDDIAEANRQYWESPSHGMIGRVVQALQAAHLKDGQTLWGQGLRTGHGKPAEEVLRDLKTRVPRQFIVATSTLPDNFDKRERLRDGYDLFARLKDEGVIETTFLGDNNSPFARTFNLDRQDRYQAMAYASLLAAQLHFQKNPSLAEVGASLGDYAAYVGMAFASRSLAVSKEVLGWGLLRRFVPALPQRGYGDISGVILEAKEATKHALTDTKALAIEDTIDLNKPVFLVYTVPIKLDQDRLWLDFSFEIRRWLANTYPTAIPVFASGNGTPDPRYSAAYWVQVSAFFPLPDVPAPLRALLTAKETRRRKAPATSSANQNGQGTPAEANHSRIEVATSTKGASS